jgi:hypothetical protein
MASIYIVNVSVGGYYTEQHSYYHHAESEAQSSFEECKASVGEDPTIIELVRLDTETLEAVTITGWEGTFDDLDEEDAEDGEEGFDDEDDGIVEGVPGE